VGEQHGQEPGGALPAGSREEGGFDTAAAQSRGGGGADGGDAQTPWQLDAGDAGGGQQGADGVGRGEDQPVEERQLGRGARQGRRIGWRRHFEEGQRLDTGAGRREGGGEIRRLPLGTRQHHAHAGQRTLAAAVAAAVSGVVVQAVLAAFLAAAAALVTAHGVSRAL
jgi:hypothetical protein